MQNNGNDPFDLFLSTTPRIIVAPGYRLNLFGFLSSTDLASLHEDPAPGNYGFWDQHAALEWTASHVHHFGGDAVNISVGGLSAGAYSSFFQLYYDSFLPDTERVIKRAYLWSNAVGVQPNTIDSVTNISQVDELLQHFNISHTAKAAEKIAALRAIPSEDFVKAIGKLDYHTFAQQQILHSSHPPSCNPSTPVPSQPDSRKTAPQSC